MTVLLDSFTFTPGSDVVAENDVILIPNESSVFTLAGDDSISAVYTTDTPLFSLPNSSGDLIDYNMGVLSEGSLNTGSGKDTIIGDVTYTGESFVLVTYGIAQSFSARRNGFSPAIMSTGNTDDKISGFASSTNSESIAGIVNFSSSEIDTGGGKDEVIGEGRGTSTRALVGISLQDSSKINTRHGADKVIGEGSGTAFDISGIIQSDGDNLIITGSGDDEVNGKGSGTAENAIVGIAQIGIDDPGNNRIITGNGNDKVIGEVNGDLITGSSSGSSPALAGISQQTGTNRIITGNDDDEVIGKANGTTSSGSPTAILGIAKENDLILTGKGNDKVIGEASGTTVQMAGIVQRGSEDKIITGQGADEVIGTATGIAADPNFGVMAGIAQQPGTGGSEIRTGSDNDKVIGTASNNGSGFTAGILGDIDILTGSGDDLVIASAELFGTRVDGFAADPFTGGAVTVKTGSGNDVVQGFGQGDFNGGGGNGDVYDLSEYQLSEFTLEIVGGSNNKVNFTHTDLFGASTASTQGFEIFRFADGEFSFSDLG